MFLQYFAINYLLIKIALFFDQVWDQKGPSEKWKKGIRTECHLCKCSKLSKIARCFVGERFHSQTMKVMEATLTGALFHFFCIEDHKLTKFSALKSKWKIILCLKVLAINFHRYLRSYFTWVKGLTQIFVLSKILSLWYCYWLLCVWEKYTRISCRQHMD